MCKIMFLTCSYRCFCSNGSACMAVMLCSEGIFILFLPSHAFLVLKHFFLNFSFILSFPFFFRRYVSIQRFNTDVHQELRLGVAELGVKRTLTKSGILKIAEGPQPPRGFLFLKKIL